MQQWNAVIALNYAAKAAGLKRIITPDEAKLRCPEVVLQHVATWREGDLAWAYRPDVRQHMNTDKAALDPYRLQSRKAFDLVKSKLPPSPAQKVEKASIDEVFLDLSAQVYAIILQRYVDLLTAFEDSANDSLLPLPPDTLLDWQSDKLIAANADAEVTLPDWDDVALKIGSEIVRGIRKDIFTELQYTCSAGIARNKTLAKLAAGHNKPNQQTVVRARAIASFYEGYRFTKIRGLGGKLGQQLVKAFSTDRVSELLNVSLQDMCAKLGSSAPWVYHVIRGQEYAEVVERTQLQSMLAAKTFVPKAKDLEHAEKWLRIFAGDLMGRLEEQDAASSSRRPRVIALRHSIEGRFGPTRSKQMQIPSGIQINPGMLFDLSKSLLIQLSHEGPTWPCLGISMSLHNFQDGVTGNHNMTSFFTPRVHKEDSVNESDQGREVAGEKHKPHREAKRKRHSQDSVSPAASKRVEASRLATFTSAIAADPNLMEDEAESVKSLYCCPKCNEYLGNASVLEHLDWHVAKELQDS